ncbi:MAG: hypothetical protein AAF621_05380, partial [Pseudomonadota bacterium]
YKVTLLFLGTNSLQDWYINLSKNLLSYEDKNLKYFIPKGRAGFRQAVINMQNHGLRKTVYNHVKVKHNITDKELQKNTIHLKIVGHSQGSAVALHALPYLDGVKRKTKGDYTLDNEEIDLNPHLQIDSIYLFAVPPTLSNTIEKLEQYLIPKYQRKLFSFSCPDDIITNLHFSLNSNIKTAFNIVPLKCTEEFWPWSGHRIPRYIESLEKFLLKKPLDEK